MSEASDEPGPYDVSYSQRVLDELKALLARAHKRGKGQEVLAVVREIHHRLKLYPQFGEPLRDLSKHSLKMWIATVWPLVVKYVLDEERRQVLVGEPLKPLSNLGL